MPECPTCYAEMDYDAMMAHDSAQCRARHRAEWLALRGLENAVTLARTFYENDQTMLVKDALGVVFDKLAAVELAREGF